MSHKPHLLLYAATAALLAACADAATDPLATPAGTPDAAASARAAQVRPERPGEAARVRLASQIPGFGGFYFQDGALVAVLTDTRQEPQARGILRAFLRGEGAGLRAHMRGDDAITIRGGDFSFTQLQDFRDRANGDLLALEGVTMTSLNQVENRLVVGIGDPSAQARVEAVLRQHGIPSNAVLTQHTRFRQNKARAAFGPTNGATLRSYVRPLQGGLVLPRLGDAAGTGCALGFVADWNGQRVFVTNSHCSSTFWETDGRRYFQHRGIDSLKYYAGKEYHDPRGYICNGIWRCRWSDAAIIQAAPGASTDRGYIARTTGLGSITVDQGVYPWTILGWTQWPEPGTTVQKVGPRTGWTQGTITGNNCADMNYSTFQIEHCQVEATYSSGDGDSGAPVFFITGGASDVYLYGIHHSNNEPSSPMLSYFSPMGGILRDLGTMTVYGTPAYGGGGGGGGGVDCGMDHDGDGFVDPC